MSLLDFADLIVIKNSERSMDIIHEEPLSMDVTLALVPEIPPIKYHDGPLQFLSKPQLTQKQYQERVLDRGDNPDNKSEDDVLTIRCPDGEESQVRIFTITRQTLSRSPTFAKFFESAYYLPNSDMLISFMNDPAIVFDIVKRYLEQGPEVFNSILLSVYLHRRYRTTERTIVLIRLCRMAHNMGLCYLHDMVFDILVDENRFITASILPTITSLIFARKASYGRHLKEWCLQHAGHHFFALKNMTEWTGCLALCEEELRMEWTKMVDQNTEILKSLDDEADDKTLEGMIQRMSLQEQRNAISVIEGTQPNVKTVKELMNDTPRKENEDSDLDDWEDITAIGSPTQGEDDQSSTDMKSLAVLDTMSSAASSPRSSGAETAKARRVMGINSGFGRPSVEVVKVKGRKSRIRSMLH